MSETKTLKLKPNYIDSGNIPEKRGLVMGRSEDKIVDVNVISLLISVKIMQMI